MFYDKISQYAIDKRGLICYNNKNLPINEDMYIAHKLIQNGYKIKYCAESEVIHSHDFSFKEQYDRWYCFR